MALPTVQTTALVPAGIVAAIYQPATGSESSKLTIWLTPRNVILRGAAADDAWAALVLLTPAGLIIPP